MPNLKWGDDDGGDDFIRSLLECVPDVVWHVIRPLLEHAFRWGKVAEVYPYPQQHYLNSLSQAWSNTTMALSLTESGLTGLVNSITLQSNSEWYDAMRKFCGSLWGTTDWGKSTAGYEWKHDSSASPTASHPVMTVLFDTAMKISDLLRELAEAAVELNGKVWDIYMEAVRQAVGDIDLSDGVDLDDVKEGAKGVGRFLKGLATGAAELSVEITLNIDTAALNAVVEAYNRRVDALTPRFATLTGALDEAHRSAPTYAAEEARAEAFGARALNDFKQQHKYTTDADEKNHFYPIDLANAEGLHGGHSVDKHVGKTDEQLAQRLRDQQITRPDGSVRPLAASSYPDMAAAQRYTQATLDDIGNAERIERWLDRLEREPVANERSTLTVDKTFTEVTGRTVPRTAYDADGLQARGTDAHGANVVLRYKRGLDPTLYRRHVHADRVAAAGDRRRKEQRPTVTILHRCRLQQRDRRRTRRHPRRGARPRRGRAVHRRDRAGPPHARQLCRRALGHAERHGVGPPRPGRRGPADRSRPGPAAGLLGPARPGRGGPGTVGVPHGHGPPPAYLAERGHRPLRGPPDVRLGGGAGGTPTCGTSPWWVESDEYETFEDGVLAGVTSEHPGGCAHLLPALIAELHAALLLDADARSAAGLRSVVPWATAPILREVLRLASGHLLEAH